MRWLLLSALLAGCIKARPVVRAEQSVEVAVASVLASVDDPTVQPAPEAVTSRLAGALTDRNLVPVPVDPARLEPFGAVRTTEGRLDLLDERPVLLVESTARFSSQINGRYRWTVDVTASIAGPETVLTEQFTVPVALVYYHEREAEALNEAAPLVARHVGGLLDEWIGAQAAR